MFVRSSRFIAALMLILLFFSFGNHLSAASPSEFSSTNSAINAAFSATYNAGQIGGNVTSLVMQLNNAVELMQKSQAENSSNPSQASTDLENATGIAQQVSSEALAIGAAGAAAKQNLLYESIGGIIAIAIFGALVYVYGGQIYRILWFLLYRDRVVRQEDG